MGYEAARLFTETLSLTARARDFLAHFIAYLASRGAWMAEGHVEGEVPSRTLKTWDRQYGLLLRLLKKKGHLEKGRGYSTNGIAQTFKLRTFPPNLQPRPNLLP